jgi:hypothetical protein
MKSFLRPIYVAITSTLEMAVCGPVFIRSLRQVFCVWKVKVHFIHVDNRVTFFM